MIRFIDYLREHIRLVTWTCYGLLLLVVVFACAVERGHHAHTWVEQKIPFFWSVFGFCAAAAIIAIARWLGRSGIQAREDYYDHSILDDSSSPDA